MTTYYQLLGVENEAGQASIRAAYLKIIKRCHPDLDQAAGSLQARSESRAQYVYRVNRAYRVLRDPQKRADYDAELMRQRLLRARRCAANRRLPMVLPAGGRRETAWAAGLRLALCLTLAIASAGVQSWGSRPDPVRRESVAGLSQPVDLPVPADPSRTAMTVDPGIHDVAAFARAMSRARAVDVSERCYSTISFHPSPSAADQCIALDVAFAQWQRGLGLAIDQDSYFAPAAATARHTRVLMRLFSRDPTAVAMRLELIRADVLSGIVATLANDVAPEERSASKDVTAAPTFSN